MFLCINVLNLYFKIQLRHTQYFSDQNFDNNGHTKYYSLHT